MNRLKVELLYSSPIWLIDEAISKCHNKKAKDLVHSKERMHRVANKMKHASTTEHVSYTWDIKYLPRFVLQELARHRVMSLTIKSSRYTLKELKDIPPFDSTGYKRVKDFIYLTGDTRVDQRSIMALTALQQSIKEGVSNDIAKASMPECYFTEGIVTMNMRSLQNFLNLRTSSSALKEIRELAYAMYASVPDEHKFMLEEFVHNYEGK